MRRQQADAYDFRHLHPQVCYGTASDRYAGWIGQIYPPSYTEQIQTRKRKLGGESFEERTLPIASVADYFQHFSVLELDFTFYRPLLDNDGNPTNNYFVLEQYANHAPEEAMFILKAPQMFFARTLRRSTKGQVSHEENPNFLDAERYTRCFHDPAIALLGEQIKGILFEQEYQRQADSVNPEENIAELDAFFRQLPRDVQPHLELRSAHLLAPPYFAWLESNGLGFVFSHWTWLPSIKDQWDRTGGRFTASDGNAIIRLLTPRNMPYAKAYAAAYPFERPVPELAETDQAKAMVNETTALAYQALAQGITLNIIANNRAFGNSPALVQALSHRFLDFADRKGV